MKALRIADLRDLVHLKLDGSSTTPGWGSVDIAQNTPCPKNDFLRTAEFHDGDFLADTPEHLRRDANLGLRVAAEYERLRRLVKTIELGRARTMGTHQRVIDRVWSWVLHEAGSVEQ